MIAKIRFALNAGKYLTIIATVAYVAGGLILGKIDANAALAAVTALLSGL